MAVIVAPAKMPLALGVAVVDIMAVVTEPNETRVATAEVVDTIAVVADAANFALAFALIDEVIGMETLAGRITIAVTEKVDTRGVITEV